MRNHAFVIIASIIIWGAFACEKPQRHVSTWTEQLMAKHRFSHTLQLHLGKIRFQIEPPEGLQDCRLCSGMTVAFHYRINDGEIMTRFLTPKLPTKEWETEIGPLGLRDHLSYYISFLIHRPDKQMNLSVDSRWFHHRSPMHQLYDAKISLQCEELFVKPGLQYFHSDRRALYKEYRPLYTPHFYCQPAV
ncbi:MAG: hypothetical protein ACOH5I_10600 [Oligoflexus sp.]